MEVIKLIDTESAAVAAVITPEVLDARVPSCPDWSLTELIWHLGRVQRFWASDVRAGDVEPTFPDEATGPADADELSAWFRASTQELLTALHEVPWDRPAWTWWKEDRTVGAIARHQVQEAAVHRWDAQLAAAGRANPLETRIAEDGVDEFLWITKQLRGPVPITFHAEDTGAVFAAGPGMPVAMVSAPDASELVLLLYSRVSADADSIAVEGDRDALDAFLIPIG
jgi:uncharacterized protein (TIGR03083 family)